MPPPFELPLEDLLAPISAESPAGDERAFRAEYDGKWRELAREERPEDFNDKTRPAKLKRAEWRDIITLSTDFLIKRSKDLKIATRLTEALLREHAFSGLREGLKLLRRLSEEAWDRLNPPITEEDGTEPRIRAYVDSLDDEEGRRPFPHFVRTTPICSNRAGQEFSFLDWKDASTGKGEVSTDDILKAAKNLPSDEAVQLVADLEECLTEATRLAEVLRDKLGTDEAPGLTRLRQAIGECQHFVLNDLGLGGGESSSETETSPTGSEPTASVEGNVSAGVSGPRGGGRASTRADAYRLMAEAARLLRTLEPHSPIPYLLERLSTLEQAGYPEIYPFLALFAPILEQVKRQEVEEQP